MEEQKVECYGSFLEADQQIVALEQDSIVDGIISEDEVIVVSRGRVVLAKLERRNGTLACKVFDRDEFIESGNKCNSQLCKYLDLIADTALLLGNNCIKMARCNSSTMLLGKYENKLILKRRTKGPHKENRLINKIAKEESKINFTSNFGNNGKRTLIEK